MSDHPKAAALLASARALVPLLAARAPGAAEAREVPNETVAAFRDAGMLRVLQPRRYGGYQASFGLFLEILDILAEGCASSAWVYAILGELQWVLALLPEKGQDEIWGTDQDAAAAGSIAPRATATRTAGGWRISGRYPFSSACSHAQWIVLGALCEGGAEPLYLVVPMREVEIAGDWHALGMRGTGSHTVILRDVFVPDHRTITIRDVVAGTPPGALVHPDYTLLRTPRYYLVPFVLPGVGFAQSRRALALVTQTLRDRSGPESEVQQLRLGQAAAEIECGNLIFTTRRADSVATVDAGLPMPPIAVARNRRDSALAFQIVRSGVDKLTALNGARSVQDSDPLQPLLRDIATIATHMVLNDQMAMVPYGRLLLQSGSSQG